MQPRSDAAMPNLAPSIHSRTHHRRRPQRLIFRAAWARIRRYHRNISGHKTFRKHRQVLSAFAALACTIVLFIFARRVFLANSDHTILNIGTAQTDILPNETVFLSGFSSRHDPPRSASLLSPIAPLRVKALVISLPEASGQTDESVSPIVIVTFDLIGIDKNFSDTIFHALAMKYGLLRHQVRLVFSHTHSGPVVGRNLFPLAPDDDIEQGKIARYAAFMVRAVIETVGHALSPSGTQQARPFFGKGSCTIAVNRRQVLETLYNKNANHGDIDPELPVLWFRKLHKPYPIIAGIFGYAAHATVLTTSNEYSGDYPSAVATSLAHVFPNSIWYFLPGCGGDLNIYPRGNQSMLIRHRNTIVREVERVIRNQNNFPSVWTQRNGIMRLHARYSVLPLRFRETFSHTDMRRRLRSKDAIMSRTAESLINSLTPEHRTRSSYLFPLSIVQIGNINVLFLAGEPTVDYATRIRKDTPVSWLVGYTDDVMGYVGSASVLREGKREGSDRAALYYGLPCAWDPGIEHDILHQAEVLLNIKS